MKVNPIVNPERKAEIRRLQRRIHELTETTSNDSKILHEIATASTQLNILQDGAQQSQFHIVEQVARSAFNQKGGQHKGELDAEIIEASLKINGLADKAATNQINLAGHALSLTSQRNIHHIFNMKI